MAVQPPGFVPLIAEVIEVRGECGAGHKTGEILEVGCWDTGGLCGYFYHDIFPTLTLMQFGGRYPWQKNDETRLECPDRDNTVVIRLRRP